jgi:hypothetical protein
LPTEEVDLTVGAVAAAHVLGDHHVSGLDCAEDVERVRAADGHLVLAVRGADQQRRRRRPILLPETSVASRTPSVIGTMTFFSIMIIATESFPGD